MNESNATDTQAQYKRVRFTKVNNPPSKKPKPPGKQLKQKTPLVTAREYILEQSESLRESIATVLSTPARQILTLLHDIHEKKRKRDRMRKNDDKIPSSVKLDFEFHMSTGAKNTAEFKALLEDTTSQISEFEKYLKSQVIQATEIEISVMIEEVR